MAAETGEPSDAEPASGTAPSEPEIAQVAVYLAKAGLQFDACIDRAAGVRTKLNFCEHSFNVGAARCDFVYFETTAAKATPPWLAFVNSRLGPTEQIPFQAKSRNPNGILGIALEGRLLIAAFGRSASASLVRKHLERDFGIKTAMNLCGNEEIRQTRTQSNSITPTHIDRQVSRPSEAFVFGLSEAEDLKSISAQMKGDPSVTLQGRDHLTVKVSGANKLDWDGLIDRCSTFLKAYDQRDYVDLFPNYRNFKAAAEAEVEKLDALLLAALKAKRFDDFQLWIPEFIPDDEFSFTYTASASRENRVYAYLDPRQLESELNLDTLTVARLHSKKIFAYSHAEDRYVPGKHWAVYDCLIFEQKLDGAYYLLTDGEWKQIDGQFYQSIVNFIASTVTEEACEPLYAGISIADMAAMKNKEEIFNNEACRRRPQSILFDRAQLKIGGGRKNKEFCDILDLTDGGVMRIINCKPFKGASAINYLFAQTRFYCESFLSDQNFVEHIRAHIAGSPSPEKQRYLDYIPPLLKDVNGADYRVCVWLLYDQREKAPTKTNLPLISQYELKLMHGRLQRTLKVQDIVLRFIPVEMVNFVKAAPPRKRAA